MSKNFIFVPDYQEDVARGPQPIWYQSIGGEARHNAIYLHGELERLAGFDIVYLAPGIQPHYVMPEYGQELVTVRMDAGERRAVMIYWWGKRSFRALICGLKDIRAVQYARRCQWIKTDIL